MSEGVVLQWREYPEYLSYSQVRSLFDCGEKFRLERRFGIKFPPRWATVGGSGFHTISQYVDEVLALGAGVTEFWHERADRLLLDQSVYRTEHEVEGEVAEQLQGVLVERMELEPELQALSVLAAAEVPGDPAEPSDVIRELWRVGFAHAIGEDVEGFLRRSPQFADTSTWRNSAKGKAGKAFPDGEDRSWWNLHGPQMVAKYIRWRHESGWVIPFIGQYPAIEMDVTFTLPDTGIKVVAYLDRVFLNPTWEPAAPSVVDHKSSRAVPKEPEQLGVYATALECLGLPRPEWGHYYDARKGVLSEPYSLAEFSIEYFNWKFQQAKYSRDNGLLQANTQSQFCRSCELQEYCYAKQGSKSHLIPRPWSEAADRRRLALTPVTS